MSGELTTGAVIVAAGRGMRMGGTDKCALPLNGRSLLSFSVGTLAAELDLVVVVVAADRIAGWHEIAEREAWPPLAAIVPGGETRQESVRAGFDALFSRRDIEIVALHDGARPLVTADAVRRCVAQARVSGAATCAMPVTDTIKRVTDGEIIETVDRTSLWAAQTPQSFRAEVLRRAFAWADTAALSPFTDEAGLVSAFGHPVVVVRGDRTNIKVTEPDDLIVATALLSARDGGVYG